jgi:hypothetical protein
MMLVEGAGKRILYTGDFRRRGRKSVLVDRFMANPPPAIDVLLNEGTNLGSDKPVKSQKEIEQDFVELFKRTKGRVFVSWSGQNIDRAPRNKAGTCLTIKGCSVAGAIAITELAGFPTASRRLPGFGRLL